MTEGRRILTLNPLPPMYSHAVGTVEGLIYDTIQAFDQGTAAIVLARTGHLLPVKVGPLRQTDIVVIPREDVPNWFDVWVVAGPVH